MDLFREFPKKVLYVRRQRSVKDTWLVTLREDEAVDACFFMKTKYRGIEVDVDRSSSHKIKQPEPAAGKTKYRSLTDMQHGKPATIHPSTQPREKIPFPTAFSTYSRSASSHTLSQSPPPSVGNLRRSACSPPLFSRRTSMPSPEADGVMAPPSHTSAVGFTPTLSPRLSPRASQQQQQQQQQFFGGDRTMKKTNSKKNLLQSVSPQPPQSQSSSQSSSQPYSQSPPPIISPSPTTPNGGAGPEPVIVGPQSKEARMARHQGRWSSPRHVGETAEKPRSQTDSAVRFVPVYHTPEKNDEYEEPFTHYSISQIIDVIKGRPSPRMPETLRDPYLYIALVTSVGVQEIVNRHPVDRSVDVLEPSVLSPSSSSLLASTEEGDISPTQEGGERKLSSRQKGERSRNRSRRKTTGPKTTGPSSGLSNVMNISDSPVSERIEAMSKSLSQLHLPNAFDDDGDYDREGAEKEKDPGLPQRKTSDSSYFSNITVANSVSHPQKSVSPHTRALPITKPSPAAVHNLKVITTIPSPQAVDPNYFQTTATTTSQHFTEIDYFSSPDLEEDETEQPVAESDHRVKAAGYYVPLLPSGLPASPSSPRHRRHISEPTKIPVSD